MRRGSVAVDHEAAVARRLERLTDELAAVRDDGEGAADPWTPVPFRPIRAVPDLEPCAGTEETVDPVAEPSEVAATLSTLPVSVPPVPRMPGRHASRRTMRTSSRWHHLVPEPLRGRVWLGPGHVVAVAMVLVAGLVATCWFLIRGDDHEVAAPVSVQTPAEGLARPEGSAGPAGPAGPDAAGSPAGGGVATGAAEVVVDVTGKVRRPGIAVLKAGDRVVDAIRAAGGARRGVDLSSLNLAQVLTDGEQIVVGGGAPAAAASATGAPATTGLVNLNTADQAALESLPEVGPVTAQAIIAWRTEHGGFSAVSQLLDVDGIGDATLAQITPFVTV